MARMRSDQDRSAMLKQMLDKTYGNEEASVPAVSPRYAKGADDPLNRRIDPQTDEDYEKMYGEEDDKSLPPMHDEVAPTRSLRRPDVPNADQASAEELEMVSVPKPIVDKVMSAMMRSASRNGISKSMGSDGQDEMPMPSRRRSA